MVGGGAGAFDKFGTRDLGGPVQSAIDSSANGRYLALWNLGRLGIIDLQTGSDLVRAAIAEAEDAHLVISADGGTVLRMQGRRIWQCDPATLEPLRPLDLAGSPSTLSCDGRFCLTDDPGAVWEPASETVLCHLGGSDAAESGLFASASEPVTFHRNGRWLLTGRISVGRSVDLWSGREILASRFFVIREGLRRQRLFA